MLTLPAISPVPKEEARQWHAIVDASKLSSLSCLLSSFCPAVSPNSAPMANKLFWVGRYVYSLHTAALFQRQGLWRQGDNPKLAAFCLGSITGHAPFISLGENVDFATWQFQSISRLVDEQV